MKLFNRIIWQISPVLILVMSFWAFLFYKAIINEINDEVDDSLEQYAESLILKKLTGEELPSMDNGTNNQYFIVEVSKELMERNMQNRYIDSMVYIQAKGETEPARILRTYFMDRDQRYWQLMISTPTIEKADLQKAILQWILGLYISLLVIIIFINIWLFRSNLRPLYVLLDWLDKYRIGKENKPLVNSTEIVEFKKLNETVERHVGRAEKVFSHQKEFIGNASHEIQTPVAICSNRLEIMMEDETLSETQLNEIMKIHHTLSYVSKLNKSLLLLSKIDNGQFSDSENICINKLINRYLPDFEEVYDYLHLQVVFRENEELYFRINESLAGILIMNLLKNAFVHNRENGKIIIEVTGRELKIMNTGKDYPLDETKIFERFYHTKRKEGSTGLGLSIIKSICNVCDFVCSYKFDHSMHCFIIRSDSSLKKG